MNWKQAAVQRLRDYDARKESIKILKEQIDVLEMQFTSIRAARTDGEPVSGNAGNHREDAMIANICRRDELTANLKVATREVELTEKGLAVLTEDEKTILDVFYIARPYDHVLRLAEMFNVEKSEIYRRKDEALRKFTVAMYGVVEI